MNENQDVFVDISTFGYSEAPENFDQKRQNQIVDYLINKGIDSSRIYTGLSPNTIRGQLAEYTIYDSLTLKKAIDEKNEELLTGGGSVTITHGILVTDITFDLNKADNPAFYEDLDVIAEFLVNNKSAKIGVYGYTDTQGNPDYNKRLSQRRADFVKNYLIKKGANPNQIVAEGRGYTKQISKNKDNEGKYIWNSLGYNRRVEIEVISQGENQKLFIKPVDVPEQYKLNLSETSKYAINVVASETKIPSTAFDFNVTELLGTDGLYNYIHGEFNTEAEAQTFLQSIKNKYPKAFIFISNYRK
jgi:outer membrane protein OmpA-like peptidoglycan-associated protein